MAALDNYILSINQNDTKRTSSVIDEVGEMLSEGYRELVEADEELLAELNGGVATDFGNAADKIEEELVTINRTLVKTSKTITDFTSKIIQIDRWADYFAGDN